MNRTRIQLAVAWFIISYMISTQTAWSQVATDAISLKAKQDQVNEQVERQLRAFQERNTASETNAETLKESRALLHQAISDALLIELQVRQERIDTARLRLDALEAKLKLSRKIIDQLAESRLKARLADLAEIRPTNRFATPDALLKQMTECVESRDMDGLVELLSDDAVNELAGCMLLSTAGMSIAAQFAESIPESMSPTELASMKSVNELIANAVLGEPPEDAKQAYKELMQIYVAVMFSQPWPESWPTIKDPIKTAAGILKDPRQFIVDASAAIERVTGTEMISDSGKTDQPLQWKVKVNGDVAIATTHADATAGVLASEIELQRIDGEWKISKLLSDDMIQAMESGAATSTVMATPMPSPTTGVPPSTSVMPANGNPNADRKGLVTTDEALMAGPEFAVPSQELSELTTNRTRFPVYSGQPIGVWLQAYWEAVTSNQPYGNSLNAIKALRTQTSSDRYIEQFLSQGYQRVENELDTTYLGKVADCIVTVAGPRHQELAVDYLFRIAEKNPRTDPIPNIPYEFGQSYFLRSAVSGLRKMDAQLAKQVAEKLQNGTSKQRELALVVLMIPDQEKNNEFPYKSSGRDEWISEHRSTFAPACLAASHDEAPHVRSLALMHLGLMAPESEEFKARLREFVESEQQTDIRSLALMNLVAIQPDDSFVHQTLMSWARSEDRELVSTAIDSMHPSDERRKQAIDELIELLQDADWGRGISLGARFPGSERKTARQHAMTALGYFESDAHRALPILQAELTRDDEATAESAGEALDRIAGFSESLPIQSLAGTWRLVGLAKPDSQPPIFPLINDSKGESEMTIDGTKVSQRDKLIARLSSARGGKQNVIRLLVDPEKERKRFSGTYNLVGETLTLSVGAFSHARLGDNNGLPMEDEGVRLGTSGMGGAYEDKAFQQVYEFRRVRNRRPESRSHR